MYTWKDAGETAICLKKFSICPIACSPCSISCRDCSGASSGSSGCMRGMRSSFGSSPKLHPQSTRFHRCSKERWVWLSPRQHGVVHLCTTVHYDDEAVLLSIPCSLL